jgi:hypothetical protein
MLALRNKVFMGMFSKEWPFLLGFALFAEIFLAGWMLSFAIFIGYRLEYLALGIALMVIGILGFCLVFVLAVERARSLLTRSPLLWR